MFTDPFEVSSPHKITAICHASLNLFRNGTHFNFLLSVQEANWKLPFTESEYWSTQASMFSSVWQWHTRRFGMISSVSKLNSSVISCKKPIQILASPYPTQLHNQTKLGTVYFMAVKAQVWDHNSCTATYWPRQLKLMDIVCPSIIWKVIDVHLCIGAFNWDLGDSSPQ